MRINGHPEHRLPNTLSAAFRGIDAPALLDRIGDRVAASAGSACHSGSTEVSPVLLAMRVPEEFARGTLRLSTGRMTTREEIEEAILAICQNYQVS
jgi:cysteine desulfurase